MFGKTDLLETLSRDLGRARRKHDVLTSDITVLTAQIADLEAQLSAESDRRERERAANEIEDIKKHLTALFWRSRKLSRGFGKGVKRQQQSFLRLATSPSYSK